MRLAAPIICGLAIAACAEAAQADLPPEVQAVIERSHSPRPDYAVIATVEVLRPAGRTVETNAEFHRQPMHRVETPATRVLINCDTGETAVYDVASAHIVSREDQSGACGIAVGADRVLSGHMLPPVVTPNGRADVIELTGVDFVRRYTLTEDGILLAGDYQQRRDDVGFSLRTLSATVSREAQDPAMFAEETLQRAYATAPR